MRCEATLRARIFGRSASAVSATVIILSFMLLTLLLVSLLLLLLLSPFIISPHCFVSKTLQVVVPISHFNCRRRCSMQL